MKSEETIPWEKFIEVGIGVLNIPPKDFWNMGLPELYLAIEGYIDANTTQTQGPLLKDELHDIMERYPD